jgi:hypothetical protein
LVSNLPLAATALDSGFLDHLHNRVCRPYPLDLGPFTHPHFHVTQGQHISTQHN